MEEFGGREDGVVIGNVVALDEGLVDIRRGLLDFGKGSRFNKEEIVRKVAGVAVENAEADGLAGVHFGARRVELEAFDSPDGDGALAFLLLGDGRREEKPEEAKSENGVDHRVLCLIKRGLEGESFKFVGIFAYEDTGFSDDGEGVFNSAF